MYLDYTPEQTALAEELRGYFAELTGPEVQARLLREGHGGATRKQIIRRLGEDGWLGVGWPKEYGGRGMSPLEQFIFFDEANRAGVPVPMISLNTVGPTLMRFGSESQKERYLPGILRGEIEFAIGYTEPRAGTDLAALGTRAVRDGDEFVVNGTKLYTSGGDVADYIWLAVRTDPAAAKHRGISLLIVDTSTPGFAVTPIHTVGGSTTTVTYYSDVRVPVENLVGSLDEGWTYITAQLNHERVALSANAVAALRLLEEVRAWAGRTTAQGGRRLIDVPWVALNLARVRARLEAMKLLNWKTASALDAGTLSPADASAAKILGTEMRLESCRLLLDVVGQSGYLAGDSEAAVLQGRLEREYRFGVVGTFGGGSNDIQREIVARVALGLPRTR